MNLTNIADHIRKNPERYLWFGPYWWSVKEILRAKRIHNFGLNDEPLTRATIDVFCNNDPDTVMQRAMQYYQTRINCFNPQYSAMPDGTSYYLHDPDVLSQAVM